MGRFETAALYAEGATSEVFRAVDRSSGRPVAIKVLRGTDAELKRRFRLEVQALARLHHPNIARLIDHGEIDGRPWLAMQFIDGAPVDRALAGQKPETVARVYLRIVDALAHAHDLCLLHRDLKPANILVQGKSEDEFDPVLVDFGLARDVELSSETATGALLGTPAFMAPEQARGERDAVDRSTDIYGLGAVLYATLAGRAPYEAASTGDVIASLLSRPPDRPGSLVPRALEAIVYRAMARDPSKRYTSARALAADLEGWLNGRSVSAMRGFRWRLARRAMSRRKWLTAGLAAAAVALAALGLQQVLLQHRATQQRELAVRLSNELSITRERIRLLHLAPAHDISEQWAFVEQRISALREQADEPETRDLPAVHFTLGRLLLDAGRPAQALVPLARARALGCDSPECASALATAHLGLHRQALERRLDSVPEAGEDSRHLDAARAVLRDVEARGRDRVAVAAAMALPEDVAELAETVLVGSPWAYEATQTVGEAHYLAGLEAMRVDELDRAFGYFERSLGYFARTAAIARSFPEAYLSTCRSLARMAEIAGVDDGRTLQRRATSMERCTLAGAIDPNRTEAHTLPASILERRAMSAYDRGNFDEAAAQIRAALELLAEAPETARGTAAFAIAEARVLATSASAEQMVGEEGISRLQHALIAAERAMALDPDSLPARSTWIVVISSLVNRGPDAAEPHVARAVEIAHGIAERWPEFRSARNALGTMLMNLAYQRRLSGTIDETPLQQAIEILRELVADAPGYARARNNLGMAWWELAVTRMEQDADFRPAEARARRLYEDLLAQAPERPSALINLSSLNLSIADRMIERGEDPGDRLMNSLILLERVRQLGEYLPCDFALALWLQSRVDQDSEAANRLERQAAEHAGAGDTGDCRRVAEALDLRVASGAGS